MKFLISILAMSLFFQLNTPISQAQTTCDKNAAALTPAPLEEEWAIDWWIPRHKEVSADETRKTADLLFLGDSITQGWETTGKVVWQEFYAETNPYNLGFSGDRTENLLWRLQNGEVEGMNPDAAVLLIGTNNTGHRQDPPECTARGIEMILNELENRLPDTQILLLAIFPRGETSGDKLRKLNREINTQIEHFSSRKLVTYVDINSVFLDENGELSVEIMPDKLHLSEAGYRLWAEAMAPHLEKILSY